MRKQSLMRDDDVCIITVEVYYTKDEDTDDYMHCIQIQTHQGKGPTIVSLDTASNALSHIQSIPRLIAMVAD